MITLTGNTLLHECAWYSRLGIAKVLLETKAHPSLNEFNRNGQTVLHIAALRSGPDFVKMLVDAGADPAALSNNPRVINETAEEIAIVGGKTANAEFLKSLGVVTQSIMFAAKMKRGKGEIKDKMSVATDADAVVQEPTSV